MNASLHSRVVYNTYYLYRNQKAIVYKSLTMLCGFSLPANKVLKIIKIVPKMRHSYLSFELGLSESFQQNLEKFVFTKYYYGYLLLNLIDKWVGPKWSNFIF